MQYLKKIIILFSLIICNIVSANESVSFLALKNNKVNVRYGPSLDYPIKFVYKKIDYPVKLIDKKDNFRRIIDYKKNSGWIHISQLKKSNSIIILEDKILFKKASKFSKPIIKLQEGRLLKIKKCVSQWCKVKVDKYSGWIIINHVWGKY
tara:strand:+ start:2274 stop:2723 length:450 start_codon:yes stop_codon:yes gene_type:complete